MPQRRSIVAVPHDLLGNLRSYTRPRKACPESCPQGVKVDHPALGVFGHDMGFRVPPLALADHDRFALGVGHHFPMRQPGPQKVFQHCQGGNRLREHPRQRQGGALVAQLPQFVGQLFMQRDNVGPLGLAVGNGDGALVEVDIRPFEPLQVAPAQSRHCCRRVPCLSARAVGNVQQARQFIVGQGPTYAPPVFAFVQLRNNRQGVGRYAPRALAPCHKRNRNLAGEVHRAGRQLRVGHSVKVPFQGVGRQFAKPRRARARNHAVKVPHFLGDMGIGLFGPAAMGEIVGDMLGQRLAVLTGVSVLPGVDHALAPQGRVSDMLCKYPLCRPPVGCPRRTLAPPARMVVPCGHDRPALDALKQGSLPV